MWLYNCMHASAGLDARAAAIVMRTVRNIVNTGRTIVCTIHQPSIDIFESFDELLLLNRGGETIFNGQLGVNSDHLIEYFQASNFLSLHSLFFTFNIATQYLMFLSPAIIMQYCSPAQLSVALYKGWAFALLRFMPCQCFTRQPRSGRTGLTNRNLLQPLMFRHSPGCQTY